MTNFVRYNLYLKPDRDQHLIDWLAGEENASLAVRERLNRSFDVAPEQSTLQTIDVAAVREAVSQALDDRQLTLGGVRQAVEAALSEALAGFSIAGETPDTESVEDSWFDEMDGMIIE